MLSRVRQEVQQQTMQELFTKISEKCFTICVAPNSSKGNKLSASEQKCLAMCMDRYVDTMSVVGNAMQKRGEREGQWKNIYIYK